MPSDLIISEDIKSIVEETQNAIIEYFQDTLGESFDESKRNRLQQVFNTFSVISEDAGTIHYYGGRCSCINKKIEINRDINVYLNEMKNGMNKKSKIMLELIHEYGHAFSNINRLIIDFEDLSSISHFEEGMQNIFSELVLNHYLKKNNIQANAISTGYGKEENSLPRTILYSMSKNDEYNNAMAEYLLGNKQKFLSMFLPQKIVRAQKLYGNMISLNFSLKDVFDMRPDAFKQINEDSIFCYQNNMIYAFWLQNFVPENILCNEFLDCSSKEEILLKYEKKYQKKILFEDEKTTCITPNLPEPKITPADATRSALKMTTANNTKEANNIEHQESTSTLECTKDVNQQDDQ